MGHELVGDLSRLVRNGYRLPNANYFDTCVGAQWVWPEEREHSLEYLALKSTSIGQWRPIGKLELEDFDLLPDEQLASRCGGDAEAAYRLYPIVSAEIKRLKLERIWRLAMAVLPILATIGGTGMAVQRDWLANRSRRLGSWLKTAKPALEHDLSIDNVDSHKQLAGVLFSKKFNAIPLHKTTEGYSTDRLSLLWGRYQARLKKQFDLERFLTRLLKYGEASKLYSTYYKPWLSVGEGLRVYSNYSLGRTATGRLCVAKGTYIEVVRDVSQYPKGIPIENVRPGDRVYTFDQRGQLTTRRVRWAGPTGQKHVIRLHWISGTGSTAQQGYLDVTPEHQVRLTSGEYKPAGTLIPLLGRKANGQLKYRRMKNRGFFGGDRITGVHRYTTAYGYSRLRFTGGPREGEFDHKIVMNVPVGYTGLHVHHKNENKLDNRPDNLELLKANEHLSFYSTAIDRIKPGAKHRTGPLREHLRKHLEETNYPYSVGYCNYRPTYNHRITRIEELPNEVAVYDIEVEDTRNFIANELCVHNSSYDLNLQNIPPKAKQLIVPSDGYDYIVQGDFKQLELATAAHISQDPILCRWICEGVDIHARQAARVLGVHEPLSKDEVARFKIEHQIERQIGKRTNFATLYGVSAESLAEQIFSDSDGKTWIPPEQVQPYIDAFYQTFQGWKRYSDWLRTQDEIVSPTGRRWWLDHSEAGHRKKLNYPIQSLASDCVLLVLWALFNILQHDKWKTRIIGEVHDSIVLETTKKELPSLVKLLKCVGENPDTTLFGFKLIIPLSLDIQYGETWGTLKTVV